MSRTNAIVGDEGKRGEENVLDEVLARELQGDWVA